MRRSNLGSGSVQRPGALKPRNADNTPNDRRSVGQQGRKSFLSKVSQPDSAKRVSSRLKSRSTEGLTRPTFASGRYTPTRNNVLSSNALAAPSSVSRTSFDSARNSGIGSKIRKETRPINDSAFKSQCIDKILDFLHKNGYEYQVQRRSLLTPSTKDFANIFNFVYRHLDGSYTLPNRIEEEIPRLLKLLHYPVQMPKSSFITVGSPHTWPSVLAMLAWLVDVAVIYESIDPLIYAFPSDFDSDVNIPMAKFSTFAKLVKCEIHSDEAEKCFEDFQHTLELDEGVRPQDMVLVQEKQEELENESATLSSGLERLQQLHNHYIQLRNDGEKMTAYCQELQIHISNKDGERSQLESVLSEFKAEVVLVQGEVERLKKLQAQQALSVEELARFKNHARDVASFISQLQQEGKDLDTKIWTTEMEVGKAQKSLSNSIRTYNALARQLELPSDYEVSSAIVSDITQHWQTVLLNEMRTRKKNAKLDTYQSQNQQRQKEDEKNMIKEMLQEKKDQANKLENKLKRVEEDILMTKNEIAVEEQEMHQESERLHQQIIEARKTHKSFLYQKQSALDIAKEELEATKIHGKERAHAGAAFLVRVCGAALEHLEFENHEANKFVESMEKTCKQLLNSVEVSDDKD
ncbi:kinetochore protein NDC80 homolog isoform X2 [Homarus americanus]|uniref:kinetochore protein NDC80 homolog isoform X2 n=1 Tax=Homarus americanus TaxID=6706 RepID=UPI001C4663E6|nr:kinetochore protein NDC80 homolog isoform X2 [Homarus americanus]